MTGITVFETGSNDSVSTNDIHYEVYENAAEGRLTIPKGYEDAILEEEPKLQWTGAEDAFSSQAVRELVAGAVAKQRSVIHAAKWLQEQTHGGIDREKLEELIRHERDTLPPLYQISSENGAPVDTVFLPDGFSLFLLLTTFLLFLQACLLTEEIVSGVRPNENLTIVRFSTGLLTPFGLIGEHQLLHPVEGFFDAAGRGGEVQAYGFRCLEKTAVLPADAVIPALL